MERIRRLQTFIENKCPRITSDPEWWGVKNAGFGFLFFSFKLHNVPTARFYPLLSFLPTDHP
jgi:hypothetical protein